MKYNINIKGKLEIKSIDEDFNKLYRNLNDFGLEIDYKKSLMLFNNNKITDLDLDYNRKGLTAIIIHGKFANIDIQISLEQSNPSVKYNINTHYSGDIKKAEFIDQLANLIEHYR